MRGVTFIELILVLALAGGLLIFAPGLFVSQRQAEGQGGALFVQFLQKGRLEAINREQGLFLTIDISAENPEAGRRVSLKESEGLVINSILLPKLSTLNRELSRKNETVDFGVLPIRGNGAGGYEAYWELPSDGLVGAGGAVFTFGEGEKLERFQMSSEGALLAF